MPTTMALLKTLVYCLVLYSFQYADAASDLDCHSFPAVRGEPVLLPCRVSGCHLSRPRWVNITGSISEELGSGINPSTGDLEVSKAAESFIGGQKYQCSCGDEESCYVINVPPLVAISVKPQNVEVGGEATVMCSITEGYPLYSEINLVCPSGIMKLKNGVPYTFHNLQLKNGGMMRCVLDAVTTQPSKSAILNVYERPHIVSTENGTADHQKGGASLGCIIHSSTNRTVVKFFKNGVEVQEDSAKFTLAPLLPKGNKTFENYLLVKRVDKGDEGCYECRIYINYTELIQVSTQDVYLVSTAGTEGSTSSECKYPKELVVGMGVTVAVVIIVAVAGWVIACACYWRQVT